MRQKITAMISVVSIVMTLVGSQTARANTIGVSGVDMELFRPAVDGNGYFGVNSARMLSAGQFTLRATESAGFGGAPLRVAINGTPYNVVDRIATTDVIVAVGLANFLTIGADVPVHAPAKEVNIFTQQSFETGGFGDVRAFIKWRLWPDEFNRKMPGIALLLQNEFPSGDPMRFFGTGKSAPSVIGIISKDFERMRFAINAGVHFSDPKTVMTIPFGQAFTYSAAFGIGQLRYGWEFMAELRGETLPGNLQRKTSPLEYTLGMRRGFTSGWDVNLGVGGRFYDAIGAPNLRLLAGVGFTIPERARRVAATTAAEASDARIESMRTTVYFSSNSATPTSQSAAWVSDTAQHLLRNAPATDVLIEGYTDAIGSDSHNQRLSQQRAQSVGRLLERDGISPERLQMRAFGSAHPIGDNRTHAGRRLNRRVEIIPVLQNENPTR